MLKKECLLASLNGAPEPGYIKAKLTIGAWGSLFNQKRGYLRNQHGNLEPNQIGSKSITNLYISISNYKFTTDVPFYYNNVKYANGSGAALYNEWTALKGQTVEIWLGGGGKNPYLASNCGSFKRVA